MARKTSITGRRLAIPAAALETPIRPNWFAGKLLTIEDFRLEQEYLAGKRRLHNLATLGAGVVSGLAVSDEPGGTGITVGAGYAVDALGREIIVPADVTIPWPTAKPRPPRRWGVVIDYMEQLTDPVPTTDGTMESTVTEGYVLTLLTERPSRDDARVVLRPFGARTAGRTRSG